MASMHLQSVMDAWLDNSVPFAPQADALCRVLGFYPDSIRARPQGKAARGDLVMGSVTALSRRC